ncbi:hypothetical protein D3C76_1424480 [compost metagenome]
MQDDANTDDLRMVQACFVCVVRVCLEGADQAHMVELSRVHSLQVFKLAERRKHMLGVWKNAQVHIIE